MSDGRTRPPLGRRLAAVAAVLLGVIVVVVTLFTIFADPLIFLAQAALLLLIGLAVWDAATRKGALRWVSAGIAAAALVGIVVFELAKGEMIALSLLLRIVALLAAAVLAQYALSLDRRTLKRRATPGKPVPAARHGALIMNLKSGGGKAEKFHLVDECTTRGIEPIVLQPGDDLLRLAHDAIGRGADVIGMAGGDGSQALVASVAAQRGVPMVVIPAGTRNHFALDLGLDREDVVGALDAYGEAFERSIDLADVNGRVFVNNVSLGLYATIVQSPEYRDAKRETTLAALPEMLGPGSEPFDLRFTGPDGTPHDGAHVLQVSNGPYGTTVKGLSSRPRLDTGKLGVFALLVPNGLAATRFIAEFAAGRADRFEGYFAWDAPSLTVGASGPIAVGLDGEALTMEPPLVFASRPGVLRVRLHAGAIGYSPAALSKPLRTLSADVWRVALGRPVKVVQ
jgi:diacylglycerol kinase family enzyme